ncbi:hypothetical protein N7536_007629 [Penicillium majusculum]|nr:hypothetical protein N7536_007629 [Penicillium majusculum]
MSNIPGSDTALQGPLRSSTPCSNCSSRGLGSSCVYTDITTSAASSPAQAASQGRLKVPTTNMQDRVNRLESLVLELMHQNESSPRKQSLGSSFSFQGYGMSEL